MTEREELIIQAIWGSKKAKLKDVLSRTGSKA
jgi:hypothetical protein